MVDVQETVRRRELGCRGLAVEVTDRGPTVDPLVPLRRLVVVEAHDAACGIILCERVLVAVGITNDQRVLVSHHGILNGSQAPDL